MRFFVYFGRLIRDLFGFAGKNKAWWIIPIVLLLLLLALGIIAIQTAAPYIYPLF